MSEESRFVDDDAAPELCDDAMVNQFYNLSCEFSQIFPVFINIYKHHARLFYIL